MIPIPIAKLRLAEPDRWPGYAAWVVDKAKAAGDGVTETHVLLSPAVLAHLQAEVARRRPGIPPRPVLTPAKIAHGIAGIAKAITGTGGSTAETIAARLSICAQCQHAHLAGGTLQQCRLCGCATWAKVRNAEEVCPDRPPRWTRQAAEGSTGDGSTAV